MRKNFTVLAAVICFMLMGFFKCNIYAQSTDVSDTTEFLTALSDSSVSEINVTGDLNVADAGIQYFSIDRDLTIKGNDHILTGGFSIDEDGLNIEIDNMNVNVPDSSMAVYLPNDTSIESLTFSFVNFTTESGSLGILPEQASSLSGKITFDTCRFDYSLDLNTQWPISDKEDSAGLELSFMGCTFYNDISSNPSLYFIYTHGDDNMVQITDSTVFQGMILLENSVESTVKDNNFDHSSLMLKSVNDVQVTGNVFIQPFQDEEYGILLDNGVDLTLKDVVIDDNAFAGIDLDDFYTGNAIVINGSFEDFDTAFESGDVTVNDNDFSMLDVGKLGVYNLIGGINAEDDGRIPVTNNKLPAWIDGYSALLGFFDNFQLGAADVSEGDLNAILTIPNTTSNSGTYDPTEDSDVYIPQRASYSWKSLTPEIATVDGSGVVTALKNGTSEIQYSINYIDGNYTVNTYKIVFTNVQQQVQPPTGDDFTGLFTVLFANMLAAAYILKLRKIIVK
ncbi:MAG: hypothetical protein LBI03_09765 [Clostridiales bacterium]|jgi:hypothetical protein|nr:hypothetical protein [Clostridiales bacterium]